MKYRFGVIWHTSEWTSTRMRARRWRKKLSEAGSVFGAEGRRDGQIRADLCADGISGAFIQFDGELRGLVASNAGFIVGLHLLNGDDFSGVIEVEDI